MAGLIWISGLLRRRTGRIVGAAIGVALVVALLGTLGAFFGAAKANMTRQAARGVPVDWQVQLTQGAPTGSALQKIQSAPGITKTALVGISDASRLRSRAGGAVQVTGAGKILGIPRNYFATFPGEVRLLVGSERGALLAQQTAANLHAGVGSKVLITRPKRPPRAIPIAGIVDLPQADSLFQTVGAPPGAGLTAPPDNVVLLPLGSWRHLYGNDPSRVIQVHAGLSRNLPSDPGAAFAQVQGRALNLEARLGGKGIVGNNLGAQLDAARSDAVYAQLLFLGLGIPGLITAGLLTAAVTAPGRQRRRKEQALLRLRGAGSRTVGRLAALEAGLVALIGCLLGGAGAVALSKLVLGSAGFGAPASQSVLWLVVAWVIGIVLAAATIVLPARIDLRASVTAARADLGRSRKPLWTRIHLDLILLVIGALVYWQAVKSGYQVVLAPEGVPTISVDYYTLAAPMMLWLGAALFTWRVTNYSLARTRGLLSRVLAGYAKGMARPIAASMSRQRRLLARGLVIVTLATSFAVSTAVFNSTYSAQSLVDAQLSNGADVAVTTSAFSGLSPSLPRRIAGAPGVAGAQSMQHRFAYVGPDLQDLYGINPRSIGTVTPMSDAFFANNNASRTLDTLASTPNGVLVSEETVHDFQLHLGDTVRLKLQFSSDNRYHLVPFKYVGVVREFPTAPHDSFLVANSGYVTKMTGSGAAQTLLVKTDGSPRQVASRIRKIVEARATVNDVVHQKRMILSGLTTVDVTGLTQIELAFALLFAVASTGLVLALGLGERRRTFAIATAVGATPSQLATFVWSEAVLVSLGGMVSGAVIGCGVALVLVKILTGVFDPPPAHLFVPWLYLVMILVTAGVAVTAAALSVIRTARRSIVTSLRDL